MARHNPSKERMGPRESNRRPVVQAALDGIVGGFIERITMRNGWPVFWVDTEAGEHVAAVFTAPEHPGERISVHYEYDKEEG